MSVMEQAEIQSLLPHRYPFLLVDRIQELDPDRRIVGIKNVTINEPFFKGIFPDARSCRGVDTRSHVSSRCGFGVEVDGARHSSGGISDRHQWREVSKTSRAR